MRKKSPAEAGHKVIGSSSSTNCGPASQPLLSGRSETRAQNCRQACSKNVEPRCRFRQARGPRQKKPRQESEAFSSAARVANLAHSLSAGGLTHPFRAAGGWMLCRHSDAAQKKPRRSGAKLGGGACRPTPSPAHEGQSRSRARNSAASHDRTSSRAVGSASAHAPRRGTRPNSRPRRINTILARTAGRLSSSIASRTALAAGRLSNAVAARTASRAA